MLFEVMLFSDFYRQAMRDSLLRLIMYILLSLHLEGVLYLHTLVQFNISFGTSVHFYSRLLFEKNIKIRIKP